MRHRGFGYAAAYLMAREVMHASPGFKKMLLLASIVGLVLWVAAACVVAAFVVV